MIKRLCWVLITFIFVLNYGCATKDVAHQKLPSEHAKQLHIKSCEVAYKPDVTMSDKLKSLIEQKFKSKIIEVDEKATNDIISLSIEIDKVKIADKGATLLAGAFVGKNSLHGTVVIYDFKKNNVIDEYRVEVDKNYGGFSAFLNLEEKISEEFTNQVLHRVVEAE